MDNPYSNSIVIYGGTETFLKDDSATMMLSSLLNHQTRLNDSTRLIKGIVLILTRVPT